MTGTVTINGVTYQVGIPDLTPADVLPVFRTDTSILKTDSILLHAAGAQQNSAKKVLIPHLISLMSSAVAEDVVLAIEPYYDASGEYQGMYWHYNGQWLRRSDTGEMIRVDDSAAEIALAAEQAVEATIAAKAATTQAASDHTRAERDHTTASQDHTAAGKDHTTALQDHSTAGTDHTTADADHTRAENMHDHQPYIADGTQAHPGDTGYFYSWNYAAQQYVRGAKLSLDWQSMTQAERDALAQDMLSALTFASVATCESIIDEIVHVTT